MQGVAPLVLGGLIGFGLLGLETAWDQHARRLSADREAAWMGTAEGRAYLDCLVRPLMLSIGGKEPVCQDGEWDRLNDARDRSGRVGSLEVAASLLFG